MNTLLLSPEDRSLLAAEIAGHVFSMMERRLQPPAPEAGVATRCTVRAFAFVLQRSEFYVCAKIRSAYIARADVDGPPYLIHVRAFKKFGVTLELAAARLALWQQQQVQILSPVLPPLPA